MVKINRTDVNKLWFSTS